MSGQSAVVSVVTQQTVSSATTSASTTGGSNIVTGKVFTIFHLQYFYPQTAASYR